MTKDPTEVWNSALGQLQMRVTRSNYDTWLTNTVGLASGPGEFVVGAPNTFVAEMLEQRMYSLISQTLEGLLGSQVEVRFTVASPDWDYESQGEDAAGAGYVGNLPNGSGDVSYRPTMTLNTRYTFDRFVVGKSNELAHAAAVAVARKPGELYNPLVMYSDVGLGKTHLMHAIGHQVATRGLSLIYSTTEEFTNAYIKAIRGGTTDDFRDHYRTADVLLLDDIQFLIGKEQTQEGFFHTFNALHMANRQIVLTSDRPVSALTLLEDRIRSRLVGGLVADIQTPDIETRIAILRNKADAARQLIPDDVLHFLAERIHRNIRELEGSLNRVLAFSDLTGAPVSVELVKRAIADVVETAADRHIPDTVVVETVATYFSMNVEELKGRRRDQRTTQARQIAMYLLREESRLDLTSIGNVLGGRDRTTARHGCDRVTNQLQVDHHLRRDIINIREAIAAS